MTTELNQLDLTIGLIGGLALFLFGMDIMTRALKQVAGSSMKTILARMTGNRFLGLIAGASVTAIIQSSSITTVLLVGFISAGLMTSAQSVAVILGANIGTTITAQILAFKVAALALPVLSLGFFISLIARRKVLREYGRIILGLGMVFYGMAIMSDAMKPLRDYAPFLQFMLSLDNVVLAALVGAGFTALVQSSSATTGILIVMAGQGLISLESAVALALGANIGTCVTALLACIGNPREAVRAALVHTFFNVAGVLIWIGLVDQLAMIARMISPTDLATEGAGIPRQLANVHTFFNVANALLFVGFTKQITWLVEWVVPDRAEPKEPEFAAKHLDPKFLDVPAFAIDAVRLEVLHLGQLLQSLVAQAIPTLTTGSPLDIDRVRVMDRPIDLLHREIVGYIRQISLRSLPSDQSALLVGLIRIANDMEHIGDMVSVGMVESARKRIEENVIVSPTTEAVLEELHAEVMQALHGVLQALDSQDPNVAEEVRRMKAGFSTLIEEVASHQAERLRAEEPRRLHTYSREIELSETLEDIFRILRRIARSEIDIFTKPAKPKSAA
ncbi:MAG: Na/Pi cotransporter family protein [Paracoccaceae bacterium]|nr:Na/Pi cotransporter family protein [Paracoccaceae bacterium]